MEVKHFFLFIMTTTLISILVNFSFLSTSSLTSPNQALPNLSGIAWVTGDTFLAIHDAKYPSESAEPRASLLSLPSQLGGTIITPLNITWPQGESLGSDLECVAKIPDIVNTKDTPLFLLGESGDNDRGSKRIFLSELNNNTLIVTNSIPWPNDIHNVEGCAVTAVDNELVFVFAERAHGSGVTNIDWATILLDPLRFGPVNSLEYQVPDEQQANFRPVSALEIDDAGKIFISSAIDPNDDAGPFASKVWLAGHISSPQNSTSSPIVLLDSPKPLASLDGLKVEGLASRPTENGSSTEIIIGTDDELNGGVLRILPQTFGTE